MDNRAIILFCNLISVIAIILSSSGIGAETGQPKFPYRTSLSSRSPEGRLPIQSTLRILRERENFLGLTSCIYQIGENTIPPYRGEIKPKTSGDVMIVVGYHYLEKPWGRIFQNEFKKTIADPLGRIHFLEIQNNNILTGDDSLASNHEIQEFIKNFPGRIKLILEVHEHLSDSNTFSGNEWPPYWYQLDNRTGGDHSIKYTILDPYIPWFCIRDYFESNERIRLPEMQKAVNETLRYTVTIINEILAAPSSVDYSPATPLSPVVEEEFQ